VTRLTAPAQARAGGPGVPAGGAGVQEPVQHPAPATPAAPVELQANRCGTWHKVLEFDAASEAETHYVCTGVERLATVDRAVAFRVVSRRRPFAVLQVYSHRHGWTLGRSKPSEWS
jgi:hypothetical protein